MADDSKIDLLIQIRDREDLDLEAFLSQHGVRARPHFGVRNGQMPDMSEVLKHPAQYVWATATATVLRAAIKAYADSKKKRLIISRLKTGTKVDATNYSVDELNKLELGFLDVGRFEKNEGDEAQ
jgi:hypothetical protein